jgi:hypothetical protein
LLQANRELKEEIEDMSSLDGRISRIERAKDEQEHGFEQTFY